jgi:hypothetical protein
VSVEASRWVVRCRPADGKLEEGGRLVVVPEVNRKVVLFVLAAHANKANKAWPSQRSIATVTGLSLRTTKRAVQSLVDDEWVFRLRRRGGSSVYVLPLGRDPGG